MNYLQIIEVIGRMQNNTTYIQLFTHTRHCYGCYNKSGDVSDKKTVIGIDDCSSGNL